MVLLALPVATAQVPVSAPGDAPPLTLRNAMDEAVRGNLELEALRREYEAARAAPIEGRYLTPPMLEAQIWAWPVTTLNPARTDMYMLTAEQELPGRGKRAARTLVMERDAEISLQQVAVSGNEILNQVNQAFLDLALAREMTVLYARQAPLLEDIAEAATLKYAAGQGGQHHTVTSLVELTRLQKERITAGQRAQSAEARLNALIGRPVAQPVEPLAPVTPAVRVTDAEALALDRHPELALAAAAIAREEAELARLRGERRPDFVVGGGYMLMPGDAGAWTARAGITWPNAPWSRGRLTAALNARRSASRPREPGARSSLHACDRAFVMQ